jgi:hypothetical protein
VCEGTQAIRPLSSKAIRARLIQEHRRACHTQPEGQVRIDFVIGGAGKAADMNEPAVGRHNNNNSDVRKGACALSWWRQARAAIHVIAQNKAER